MADSIERAADVARNGQGLSAMDLIERAKHAHRHDHPEAVERLLRAAARLDEHAARCTAEELDVAWWVNLGA